jgi:hypothetical protein
MSRTLSIYIDSPPLYLCPCAGTRKRFPTLSRFACLAVAAGCAAIALATTALYSYEWSARVDASVEAARLATTLAHVRQLAQAQRRGADANATEARRELADAARRLASLQAAIAAASSADPVALRTALDTATRDLAAAAAANAQLSTQLAQLRQSAAALPPVAPSMAAAPAALERQHALETANADLLAQVDTLKSQLLQLAAQTAEENTSDSPSPPQAVPQPLVETRWALGITYDTAAGFANLCFDRNSLRESPADPYRKSAATRADGASTFRFTHDAAHDRVFSAALTVSLAPDAPRDRLTENAKLAALFLHTFAPACKNPDEWLAAATRQLAGKGSSDRLTLLDTTYKITAFNDTHNTFTLKVESPRNDLDE